MSKLQHLARRLPQFSVASLMIVTACCAIGLGTLHNAIQTIASCFFVVECWRQARFLQGKPTPQKLEQRFGYWWAIIARISCAILLMALVLLAMLLSNGIVQLPEHDDLWLQGFPNPLWHIVLVVTTVLTCRGQRTFLRPRPFASFVSATIAVLFLGYVVSQQLLIPHLVHRAAEGIELGRPVRLRRPGLYPDHASEGFFTSWTGFVAAFFILLAAVLLISISARYRARKQLSNKLCIAFIAVLSASLGHAFWYYRWEFHRISPDLASAGLAANWLDWLVGGFDCPD